MSDYAKTRIGGMDVTTDPYGLPSLTDQIRSPEFKDAICRAHFALMNFKTQRGYKGREELEANRDAAGVLEEVFPEILRGEV